MEESNEVSKDNKPIKAEKKQISDKAVIIFFVTGVLLIAAILFGVFFYKTNSGSVISFDGGKVTNAEYTIYYKVFAPMLEYYGYPASVIPEQVANKAAVDKILIKMAKDAGIKLTDEDKKAVDDIFADSNNVATYVEQGIDLGKMRELYYNDYIISDYIDKLTSEVTAEELINFIKNTYGEEANLNAYHTRHILFKTMDTSTYASLSDEEIASKKQKAEEVLNRIKAGEDFATLAKEFSEDGTAENGGAFTMYMNDTVYTEYSDAVMSLKSGEVYATLVQTEAGFHIIKLDSIEENGRQNNETEKEELVNNNINSIAEEKNVKIDTAGLNKLVEQITGVKVDTSTDDDNHDEENNEE